MVLVMRRTFYACIRTPNFKGCLLEQRENEMLREYSTYSASNASNMKTVSFKVCTRQFLLVVFSACGGIRMPVLKAYFPELA